MAKARKASSKASKTSSAPARAAKAARATKADSSSACAFPCFPSAESCLEPFRQIQNSFQEIFSSGFQPFAFEKFFKDFDPLKAFSPFQPAINITEDKDTYKVIACVPEINPENVEVCVGDNCVTISSKSESRESGKSGNANYNTWSARSFYRSIPLPEVANTAKAEADFTNGILTISVPKRSTAADKGRKIQIGKKSA